MEADPGGIAELQKPDGAIGIDKVTLGEGGKGDVGKAHSDSGELESV